MPRREISLTRPPPKSPDRSASLRAEPSEAPQAGFHRFATTADKESLENLLKYVEILQEWDLNGAEACVDEQRATVAVDPGRVDTLDCDKENEE